MLWMIQITTKRPLNIYVKLWGGWEQISVLDSASSTSLWLDRQSAKWDAGGVALEGVLNYQYHSIPSHRTPPAPASTDRAMALACANGALSCIIVDHGHQRALTMVHQWCPFNKGWLGVPR